MRKWRLIVYYRRRTIFRLCSSHSREMGVLWMSHDVTWRMESLQLLWSMVMKQVEELSNQEYSIDTVDDDRLHRRE